MLHAIVNFGSQLETYLVSVERIHEYCQAPQEVRLNTSNKPQLSVYGRSR